MKEIKVLTGEIDIFKNSKWDLNTFYRIDNCDFDKNSPIQQYQKIVDEINYLKKLKLENVIGMILTTNSFFIIKYLV